MENSDLIWFLAFLVLLVIINTIHHLIDKSLSEKALGSQSIYDSAMQDTFKGMLPHQFYHAPLSHFQYLFLFKNTALKVITKLKIVINYCTVKRMCQWGFLSDEMLCHLHLCYVHGIKVSKCQKDCLGKQLLTYPRLLPILLWIHLSVHQCQERYSQNVKIQF